VLFQTYRWCISKKKKKKKKRIDGGSNHPELIRMDQVQMIASRGGHLEGFGVVQPFINHRLRAINHLFYPFFFFFLFCLFSFVRIWTIHLKGRVKMKSIVRCNTLSVLHRILVHKDWLNRSRKACARAVGVLAGRGMMGNYKEPAQE
jgi:hypothetical protein